MRLERVHLELDDWEKDIFPPAEGFDSAWWRSTVLFDVEPGEAPAAYSLIHGHLEVCRALVVHRDKLPQVYPCLELPGPILEYRLVETAAHSRRRGFATELVDRVNAAEPESERMALSTSNPFWSSLGWKEFLHPVDPEYKTLFVDGADGGRRSPKR